MKITIFGTAGHAGDVADIAIDNGYTDIVFLTKNTGLDSYCGYPVFMDSPEAVAKLDREGYVFALGVGDPMVREAIYNNNPALNYPILIHSSVTLGNLQKKPIDQCCGTVIAAGARITNNVSIGDFVFLGINVVVGHDCLVEDFVSLMPNAVVSGNVHLCRGSYVGCNASIRQGSDEKKLTIGMSSTVGMGAVVLNDIPEKHTAVGVPAIYSKNL